MKRLTHCLAGIALACTTLTVLAEDLGQYGNVWGIQEQDAIDMIKGRIGRMQKNGSLNRFWKGYRSKAIAGIENPAPIPGISTATGSRTWTFNPTFVFKSKVTDHLGNVVVPAGTRINPLNYTRLSKSLLFIDGRDRRQVDYAKKRIQKFPQDKVILVAGSFLSLSRAWHRPVYFDQQGILVHHFGIKKVPCVLSQSGKVLKIVEFAP